MGLKFSQATRQQARARIALIGPSGSGKTWTAITIAQVLAGDLPIAVIDSERGSAAKYARLGEVGPGSWDFLHLDLPDHSPRTYIDAIDAAAEAGAGCVIIDSLSHAWAGKGGALEMVDAATKRSKSHNSHLAWGEVTPWQTRLIDTILSSPLHVICTLRVKTEWVIEEDSRGRKVPRKVGMAPVQRAGVEYEFDLVGDMDDQHQLVVTKTRCQALDGAVIDRPGPDLGRTLAAWLGAGEEAPTDAPQHTEDAPAEYVSVDELRGLIGTALKGGVWTREEVAGVLDGHGAKKVVDLSPSGRTACYKRMLKDPPSLDAWGNETDKDEAVTAKQENDNG